MGGQESTPRTLVIENEDVNVEKVPVTSAVSRAVSAGTDEEGWTSEDSNRQSASTRRALARHAKYEERIRSLELKNATLFHTKLDQLTDAIKRVEGKYMQTTEPAVCADKQAAVIKCYSENAQQTLKCAAQVHAFSNCTLHYRQVVEGK